MALESLKKQMVEMDQKINKLTTDIDKKEIIIYDLEIKFQQLNEQLNSEKQLIESWKVNKSYLIDVKTETESNFAQIDNAASTLLEILKSKTDKI